MQFRPNNKDCHIFSCMKAIMQKCISMALNHIHSRTHKSYYLRHFISATGGQEAIRLTAVRSKSFEGEHHRILISAIYIHLSRAGCGTFTTNMKPESGVLPIASHGKISSFIYGNTHIIVGCLVDHAIFNKVI